MSLLEPQPDIHRLLMTGKSTVTFWVKVDFPIGNMC